MNEHDKIAVTSRSFSRHPILRTQLLSRYKNVKFNDDGRKLENDELVKFLQDASKAIIGLEKLDEAILKQLPHLKTISKFGVGLDQINLKDIENFNIELNYTPGVNKRSVTELVIGLAICALRQIPKLNQELKNGIWQQVKGSQLTGKRVGIIGFGAIGKDLASILQAFSCEIFVYDIIKPVETEYFNVRMTSLDELLSSADIISLHLPLNNSTHHILNAERLQLLKPHSILINTARGKLVDEVALKMLLGENKIAAAAFDVFAVEPPEDVELISLSNFITTPHIGGSTEEAILAMGLAAIEGLVTKGVTTSPSL